MSEVFIHNTAVIDEGAEIGDGSKVWHWSHVVSGAKVGSLCTIGQNVYISGKAIVGSGCKIQNNVSIYDDVTLEDHVFCGPSMVFTNVANPRSEYPRKNKYQSTLVRHGASIGANATIVCGVTIGKYAFIGAGAVITRDVPDYALMTGVPARQSGWISAYGERLPFPLFGEDSFRCPATGHEYLLQGEAVKRIET